MLDDRDNRVISPEGSPHAALHVSDGMVRNVTINQYERPQFEYCPCCNREVIQRDERFRCSVCGKQPIHVLCRDPELNVCTICARLHQSEELQRQQCGRLQLRISSPYGEQKVFLFAKRTLQVGRSREDQIPPMRYSHSTGQYIPPGSNDLILRKMCRKNDALHAIPEESRLISRIHGAFRVVSDGAQETLNAIDCGMDGSGSSNGIWMLNNILPKSVWHSIPDCVSLTMGRDSSRSLDGLPLYAQVLRTPLNPVRIDAVTFLRSDGLKDHHRYVMVVNEASIGWGCDLAVPLADDPTFQWGVIRIEGTRYVYRPCEESPLRAENASSPDGTTTLRPGVKLIANDFKVEVVEVSDRSFCAV